MLLDNASCNLESFEVVEAIGCLRGWESLAPNRWGAFKPSSLLPKNNGFFFNIFFLSWKGFKIES